jgi:hypothetical protein
MDSSLYQAWLDAKESERKAIESRRNLEDQMIRGFDFLETYEGTKTYHDGGFEVKIVGRMARTVDSDKLQAIASENGLTDHLSTLFRWKAEISKAAWEAASQNITKSLSEAITTKPGRPSFTITKEA